MGSRRDGRKLGKASAEPVLSKFLISQKRETATRFLLHAGSVLGLWVLSCPRQDRRFPREPDTRQFASKGWPPLSKTLKARASVRSKAAQQRLQAPAAAT